ncbi:MAG: sugar ABC transporter ATP-binding protein [Candidatus Binatia bacterium]|nr:sugar ABC transporter ATP-binding protein [Candidatus Binatia bacterium]
MPIAARPPDTIAELHNVSVRFGDTRAVDAVSLTLRSAEVHALLGENGAGKSTLLKVFAGLVRPNTGAVRARQGIRVAFVPQELEMPWTLTVADWLFLGHEMKTRWHSLDRDRQRASASEWLRRFRLTLSADAPLATLSAPQLKWVQILRAASMKPDLLLLDEPTATLSLADTAVLFEYLTTMRASGAAVVFVTHRLAEIQSLADWVTVMRDGQVVASGPQPSFPPDHLLKLMAGSGKVQPSLPSPPQGTLCLQVAELSSGQVHGVSFTLQEGEIVGLAGLSGSGRSTLLEALAGLRPFTATRFFRVEPSAFVPEDRLRKGLLPSLSLRENVFVPAPHSWLHHRRERELLRPWLDRLRIRSAGPDAPLSSLSGGNQQKVLLARALRRQPRLLLLDEPTTGVDVATKADIYALLQSLAREGCGVLWASSDAQELLEHSHRVLALYRGRLIADRLSSSLNEAELVALITGASGGSRVLLP